MKEIVLIGASGFVGSAILNEALQRDFKVKAIVRNAKKITVRHPNLRVVEANVASESLVSKLCKGYDTVISAYNPGWGNPNIYTETLSVYPAILNGVKRAGVKRLLCVGGAGTLFIAPGVRIIDSEELPEEFKAGFLSLSEFYLNTLLKEKDIDWIFFSPAASLESGERTGKFRLGKDDLIVDEEGNSHISVQDYAIAMIDEAEIPLHHKERFTIGY